MPAGQSTQMIVGATPENDYQMMAVTQALYENYGLKRVFYSAYVPVNDDSCLPSVTARPPLLREHRLYQADWLLRFYGFKAEEAAVGGTAEFQRISGSKCDWACATWSCSRWKSTGLPTGSFSGFPAWE